MHLPPLPTLPAFPHTCLNVMAVCTCDTEAELRRTNDAVDVQRPEEQDEFRQFV